MKLKYKVLLLKLWSDILPKAEEMLLTTAALLSDMDWVEYSSQTAMRGI